jgi:hypothetical protein
MPSLARTLWDFLSFQTFVSPYALIGFYYLGALVMPLATWGLMIWARRRIRLLGNTYELARGLALDRLSSRQRVLVMLWSWAPFCSWNCCGACCSSS